MSNKKPWFSTVDVENYGFSAYVKRDHATGLTELYFLPIFSFKMS
ncbi:hypothetical protein C1A50_0810 [Paenibacillus polymyxa]|nr:hypothetical protein C1A50_0810 [Paenibacillus polymyxa]